MSKWEIVKLGEVCEIVSGTTPKSNVPEYWDGEFNWVTPAELDDQTDTVYETQRKITVAGIRASSLKPFPAGTVLLSSRAPIGKVAISGVEMYCNQGFKNLVCSENLYNRYLFRYLRGQTDYLNSLGRGATFKEISKSIVASISIPLPPIGVQHKIAEVLDRLSTLIAERRQQMEQLDLLVKSQFVEMFGDPVTNPMEWCVKPLGKCGSLKNGINYTQRDSGYTVRCLGVGDFRSLYRIDDIYRISEISLSSQPAQDYLLQDDDIVFVRSNGNRALVGRSVAVFPGEEELTFSGFCIRYRNESTEVLTVYLNHALHLPTMKAALLSDGRGANIQNVNQQALSSLRIPIPPLQLQNRFADFVRQADKSKFNVSLRVLSGFCGLNGHVGIKWA